MKRPNSRLLWLSGRRLFWGPVLVGAMWCGLAWLEHPDRLCSWNVDTLFAAKALLSPSAPRVDHLPGNPGGPRDRRILEAVVLLMDVPTNGWRPFAEIVDNLASAKVGMVVFDLAFLGPRWSDPDASHGLLHSLSNALNVHNGIRLVFGTEIDTGPNREQVALLGSNSERDLFEGLEDFIEAHTNHCALAILSTPSNVVTRIYYSTLNTPHQALGSVAASLALGYPINAPWPAAPPFLLNYLGPAGALVWSPPSTGLWSALEGKTVFIGASAVSGDVHRVPLTRWTGKWSSGAEIHATAYRNLVAAALKQSRLGLIPAAGWMAATAIFWGGALLGLMFLWCLPTKLWLTIPLLILPGLVAVLAATYAFTRWNVIFPWWIVALPQTVTALLLAWLPAKSAFISHKSDDGKDHARLIAKSLRQLGVDAYLDEKDNKAGAVAKHFDARVRERKNFILLVTRELYASSRFSKRDFKTPRSFVEKLSRSPDAVSACLRARLHPGTVPELPEGSNIPDADMEILVAELNRLIREPVFEESAFAGIQLRQDLRALLDRKPEGEELAYANRALLEDAYVNEITQTNYWFVMEEIRTAQRSGRNIVPVLWDPEKWGQQANGSTVNGNEVEAWVRKRWQFEPSLRIFRYEERTGPERIQEIAASLEWHPLYRHWCIT